MKYLPKVLLGKKNIFTSSKEKIMFNNNIYTNTINFNNLV